MREETIILNVDDHEVNRYTRSRVLKSAGYQVVEASNGGDALRLAKELKPALILLDVNMPDISGLEVCRRIKSDPSLESVLVLQISASLVEPQDKATALDGGADSYLTDPLEPAELLATVRALLRLRDAEQQWKRSEQQFRAMFENAAVGIAHVALDGGWLLFNDKLCEITGYPRETLQTLTFQDITHPDDLDADLNLGKQLVAGEINSFVLEKRYLRPDGSHVWANLTVSLVHDTGGAPQYFVTIIEDITDRKTAANRLRESEERLRLALDSSETGIHVWNIAEETIYWDEQVRRLWGITSTEEVNFETFINGLHPDDREPTQDAVKQALDPARDGKYFAEYRVTGRDDGQTRWIAATGQVFFENGAPVRLVGTARDVSDAKGSEKLLRQSEANLRLATQAARMYSWEHDIETRITTFGENFSRVLGLKEHVSRLELGEILDNLIHPDDREKSAAYIQEAIDDRASSLETRLINPETGAIVWVETSCYLIRHSDGTPDRLVGVSQNITERKFSEERLHESNAVLTAININTPTLIYVKDRQGRILSANPSTCRVIGKPLQEIVGKNEFEYLDDLKAATMIRANDLQIIHNGKTETFEEVIGDNADAVVFLSTKTPYRSEGGEIIGVIGVSVDITERRQAELDRQTLLEATEDARRQAEAANRSKDEFLAVLSHELRAPLNSMYGWTRILQANELDPERKQQAIDVIARNVALQNTLIEDLLDASRIISGKMRIETETTSLFSIVSAAVETARPTAEKRRISLEVDFDPTADRMLGDTDRLQQVVGNLLTNAVKFTPPGGKVSVKTLRDHARNTAKLIITDTGSGIEAEFLPFIFERFRQADSSSKRRFGGLGLGLTIVKNLVELHGGTVSAFSDGADKGATFTIELPLLPENFSSAGLQNTPAISENGATVKISLGGLRILLIDDDTDSLDMICYALKREGAEVVCRDTAKKGLVELNSKTFDLIISDLGMAEMDGFDLIKKVREQEAGDARLIPAIALTGYVSADDRERTLEAGFQAHVSKPVDFENLSNVILGVVQNRQTAA